ncbi:unnamed protein product [Bursaphelenchus okinawaensis]|uniref:Uncharacterized protein n=1 Tax=Bursaphelenchus okinawaensis TaxID=465554 RepID=A0A811L819_9BILA|nr:unnamed protein product [Bursaphelenchus okinawaensis]CAG9117452.1 unnamed protein product [Bursaphelenchus okinawaensis]
MDPSSEYWKTLGQIPTTTTGMPFEYGWPGTTMLNCFPPTSQGLMNPLEPQLTSLDGPTVKDEIKHEVTFIPGGCS